VAQVVCPPRGCAEAAISHRPNDLAFEEVDTEADRVTYHASRPEWNTPLQDLVRRPKAAPPSVSRRTANRSHIGTNQTKPGRGGLIMTTGTDDARQTAKRRRKWIYIIGPTATLVAAAITAGTMIHISAQPDIAPVDANRPCGEQVAVGEVSDSLDIRLTQESPMDPTQPLQMEFAPYGACHAILLMQWQGSGHFQVHSECALPPRNFEVKECRIETSKLKPRSAIDNVALYQVRVITVTENGYQKIVDRGYLDPSRTDTKVRIKDFEKLLGADLSTQYRNRAYIPIANPG
jgi:hypothetical protein